MSPDSIPQAPSLEDQIKALDEQIQDANAGFDGELAGKLESQKRALEIKLDSTAPQGESVAEIVKEGDPVKLQELDEKFAVTPVTPQASAEVAQLVTETDPEAAAHNAPELVPESAPKQEGEISSLRTRIRDIDAENDRLDKEFNSPEGEFAKLGKEKIELEEKAKMIDLNAEKTIKEGGTITTDSKRSLLTKQIKQLREKREELYQEYRKGTVQPLLDERFRLSDAYDSLTTKKNFADKVGALKAQGQSSSFEGKSYEDIANELKDLKIKRQESGGDGYGIGGYSDPDKVILDLNYITETNSLKSEEKENLLNLLGSAVHSGTLGKTGSDYMKLYRESAQEVKSEN